MIKKLINIYKTIKYIILKLYKMAKQVIGIGSAYDDPSADKIRDGFDKANDNFTEIYEFMENHVTIPIGAWNMDTDATLLLDYTIPTGKTIVSISAVIHDNIGDIKKPIDFENLTTFKSQGNIYYDDTRFYLSRLGSGDFDSTDYNGTTNRGYIKVELIDI